MDKHTLLSIEKFAAFLDGNLTDSEMQQFTQLVEHDQMVQSMMEASGNIATSYDDNDLQLPSEINDSDFEIPDLDKVAFGEYIEDSIIDNAHLYMQEDIHASEILQNVSETFKDSNMMENSFRTYGQAGENIHDPIFIKQPDDHSCGLRCQQIVLRDFGIDIPFEDLETIAKNAGVYSDNGTSTYDIGKVLQMAGVGMHQVQGSTIYDLTAELSQGHRVIVSVDADELWYNKNLKGKLANWLNDVFGRQGGNHAVIVAGIEVNPMDTNDVKVVLTDPGNGYLRAEYSFQQFVDAWKDSNCFMVATDEAAPYQYDSSTRMEMPSNFAIQHQFNQFVIDHGYQLDPDLINIPSGYQPAFTGRIDLLKENSKTDDNSCLNNKDNGRDEIIEELHLTDSLCDNPMKDEDEKMVFGEVYSDSPDLKDIDTTHGDHEFFIKDDSDNENNSLNTEEDNEFKI